jgi:enamine deaminase RidA (YjgF/YER057c/UK114 family)
MSIVCYEGGSKEQVKRSEVYGKLLEGNGMEREGLPATLVPVERLARKGLLFEIEAMAVVAGYEAK